MAPEQVQIPDTHHHSCDRMRAAVSELPDGVYAGTEMSDNDRFGE